MSAFGWEDFFESVSLVDEILRNGSNFGEMDFATRDYYRHASRRSIARFQSHEIDVAKRAVERAKRARAELHGDGQPSDERKADPGYYLISAGRIDFERELGFRVAWRRGLLRLYVRLPSRAIWAPSQYLPRLFWRLPLAHARDLGVSAPYLWRCSACLLRSRCRTWRSR